MFKPKVTLTLIFILAMLFLAACSPNRRGNGTGGVDIATAVPMTHSVYAGPQEDVTFANETCVTGGRRLPHTSAYHENYFALLTPAQKERCVRIISILCDEFDKSSKEIEPIPAWRPIGPPVGYLQYLTQKYSRRREGESIVHNQFACSMYAGLLEANANIQEQRRQLYDIYRFRQAMGSSQLNPNVLARADFVAYNGNLKAILDGYRMGSKMPSLQMNVNHPQQQIAWAEAFKKVDVIPLPVILMIGANESNYGRSDVLRRSWNLFGRHAAVPRTCASRGTCVVNVHGTTYFEKYYSFQPAMDDQFVYMNGHAVASEMRDIRLSLRQQGKALQSRQLVCGFDRYSGTPAEYCTKKWHQYVTGIGNWEKYDRILADRDVIPKDIGL